MTEKGNGAGDAPAEMVSVELPAPAGWTKKFIPTKGGTPRRNEILFISPTGEEIKNKSQLDQYLKSHPGGSLSSEFDWGTGDTPRRSARISEKAKAVESPEGEKPKKRERKLSSKKGAKEKKDDESAGGEHPEIKEESSGEAKEPAVEETNDVLDKEVKDERAGVQVAVDEGTASAVITGSVKEDSEDKTTENVEEKVEQHLQNNDKTTDSELLPTATELKEEAPPEKDGEVHPENGSQKDCRCP